MGLNLTKKEYWILTRDQFIEELDKELARTRTKRIAKFDRGAKKYGEEVNLFDRDFDEEIDDENTDKDNYALFKRVFKKRQRELPK